VPVVFDRRGSVEFLNRHVNLLISGRSDGGLYVKDGLMRSGDVIIDFEPQVASRREGMALSDDGILARFYNNVAAEYLAQGDLPLAYAHFKAAVLTDPGYSPSYSNLAQLYTRKGFLQSAEQLLLHAIALNDDSDIALRSLHQLLVSQGRQSEALSTRRFCSPDKRRIRITGSASDSITSREGIIKKPLTLLSVRRI